MSEKTDTILEVQDGEIDLSEVFKKVDDFIKEEIKDGKAS
jgi:hypothetical protein